MFGTGHSHAISEEFFYRAGGFACVKKCPVEARYYDDPDYIYHLKDVEDRHTRRAEPELFLK